MNSRLVGASMLAAALLAMAALRIQPVEADDTNLPSTTLVIHADQPGAMINRDIYGQFAEHLGRGVYEGIWVGEKSSIPNTRGFRNDVIAALRAQHVPIVRWPGGCFADEYHWRDGIGPRDKRPVTLNTNWGGVPETNAFGTHEFLDFTNMIGADAYINGNLGTGSPREMAEWLQYMTSDKDTSLTRERAKNGHPGPWKIAYFAVGNEAWGCGGNMTPDYYVDLFKQTSTYLKAPQGARPAILASGGNDDDTSWATALISSVHRGMDAISFHYYTRPHEEEWDHKGPATGFGEDEWISTLSNTLRMEHFIAQNAAIMDKYDPEKKVAFSVDEWGTWYDPETGQNPGFLFQKNTLRDAVVAALNFNIFHHHADRVRMTAIAQMVNVLQAMILTDGPKMVLTPTYHAFHMFIPFQGATYLPSDLDAPKYEYGKLSVPAVSVSAARTADGKIILALVNLDPDKSAPVSATIEGASAQHVSGTILTATAMNAQNTFADPDAVREAQFMGASLAGVKLTVTVPAKSVLVLTLE